MIRVLRAGKMITKYSFLVSLLFLLSIPLLGQTGEEQAEYIVVKDLRSEWLTVD